MTKTPTMWETVQKLLEGGQVLTVSQLVHMSGFSSDSLSGMMRRMARYKRVEVVTGHGPKGGNGYRLPQPSGPSQTVYDLLDT